MKTETMRTKTSAHCWRCYAAGMLLLTLLLGLFAAPASALRRPGPIAHDAVRLKITQDQPGRRNIRFLTTRVQRGSGHTRYVKGNGTFLGGRGVRYFTYSANIDTGNGAVNGVNYSLR